MPKVWNKRDKNCPKDAVYVGRPSKWGNPYKIGKDGNREEVLLKYKEYLDNTSFLYYNNPKIELKGKDLCCWCKPAACHADILLELANR